MPREEIPMQDRILDLLAESREEWLSGEYISSELGISRGMVSKHIASLRDEGNVIDSTRKGYRLVSRVAPCAREDAQKGLLTRSLGQSRWIWLKEASSTNQVAAQEALEGAAEGLVVVAQRQNEGRSSRGERWVSLPGGLHFSVLIRVNWPADRLSELTLLAQEACIAAVESAGGPRLEKGPSCELHLNGSKVGGILVESMFHNDAMRWAVIGVGLNVNTPADAIPAELHGTATSLYAETGRALCANTILRNTLEELEQRIG